MNSLPNSLSRIKASWAPTTKEIKVPTLILGGKQDVLLPSRNSKILARNTSNSELKILQGGHGFWIESEKEFTKVVLDFLSKYKIQE